MFKSIGYSLDTIIALLFVSGLIKESCCYLLSPSKVGLSKRQYDVFHSECDAEVSERQACGTQTDELTCVLNQCCWQPCDDCPEDTPACFLARRMIREECTVPYEYKTDCGYHGITEAECLMRDCCWAPSPRHNSPKCFRSKDMRLVDGDQYTGRLEIKYNGTWGTVCADLFGDSEAQVVCRHLGHWGGEISRKFGPGKGEILLDNVNCRGDEYSLSECWHRTWGMHNCQHSEDVGIVCFPLEPLKFPLNYNNTVRLVGGNETAGRVEIYRYWRWGTVCDDDFSENNARVVCRQLGLESESPVVTNEFGGNSEIDILMDNVKCRGDEESLDECFNIGWGLHNCRHAEDVGVICG